MPARSLASALILSVVVLAVGCNATSDPNESADSGDDFGSPDMIACTAPEIMTLRLGRSTGSTEDRRVWDERVTSLRRLTPDIEDEELKRAMREFVSALPRANLDRPSDNEEFIKTSARVHERCDELGLIE
ncbi:MAG: hypothetical protein ACRDKJ_14450 [Actinomycetota bacterium]